MGRAVGLDELRVDWLLGDPRWGSRIGELTYMGAGSRVTPPISRRLSRAYAAGHLCRLGLLTIRRVECDIDLQVAADSHPPSCLWPVGVLDTARQGHARRAAAADGGPLAQEK